MKIITVLGARPQFIKASVVSQALRNPESSVEEVVVHTGQHFDANMSDIFFNELAMAQPRYNLAIHGGSHGEMTARMLSGIERVLLDEKPDAILVYGDTNSTLAGALAAAKLHIPIAHVEAGLRSFNMRMPEEVNRVLTDRVSRWLFTPTDTADANLLREGVDAESILRVGDVMYDVALRFGAKLGQDGRLRVPGLPAGSSYVLVTIHRAENTDDPARLFAIMEGLNKISREIMVVWPVHPRTRAMLDRLAINAVSLGVTFIDPVGYLDMVRLQIGASVIVTDSGGVQKEAFFHRIPCVTLRDETEWTELIDSGWNRLIPPRDGKTIASAVRGAIGTTGQDVAPYGTGNAAEMIVAALTT
jgi:UDP-GlcNAc3NAcA epimerase